MSNVAGLPIAEREPYVTRREIAARMGISVRSFDKLRAKGLAEGNPCPQESWGLKKVVFQPSRTIAWARTLGVGE